MDDLQRRLAELIWQREPELLEDLSRLKGLLADYLPHHPARRRALLIAVECKVAASIQACTSDRLPILRSQVLGRLKTEGLRDEDSEWTVETWMFLFGPGFDSEACFQMGRELAPARLFVQLETTEADDANLFRAACCFRRSASGGHAEACAWLGEMYRLGKGVPSNIREASKWVRQGADSGSAMAQSLLGSAYLVGNGVEQSIDEAIDWLHKAAEQGEAAAQWKLGRIYSSPTYGKHDIEKAVTWLQMAAIQGHSWAAKELGELHHRQGNNSDAILWFTKAASSGDPTAQVNLGIIYENGEHPQGRKSEDGHEARTPDLENAVHWYRMAAEAGDADGQSNLGDMYEHGKGVDVDKTIKKVKDLKNFLSSKVETFLDAMKEKMPLQKVINNYGGQVYLEELERYNKTGQELSEETGEPFEPMQSVFDTKKEASQLASNEQSEELLKQNEEKYGKDFRYMKFSVANSMSIIDGTKKRFMFNFDKYSPDVKDDLTAINDYAGKVVHDDIWEPIPENMAKTDMGRKFLQQINQQIDNIRIKQKITGIPISALK